MIALVFCALMALNWALFYLAAAFVVGNIYWIPVTMTWGLDARAILMFIFLVWSAVGVAVATTGVDHFEDRMRKRYGRG